MKIAIYLPGIFEVETDGYEQVDLSEIGSLDDAAYEEIFVDSCLDFIQQRDDFTQELVKKIRYGGQLVISGSDIYEISRAMMSKNLGLEEANSIMYDGRYSISSVLDMVAKLQKLGLTILRKRVNNFKYTIIAERPTPDDKNAV